MVYYCHLCLKDTMFFTFCVFYILACKFYILACVFYILACKGIMLFCHAKTKQNGNPKSYKLRCPLKTSWIFPTQEVKTFIVIIIALQLPSFSCFPKSFHTLHIHRRFGLLHMVWAWKLSDICSNETFYLLPQLKIS